MTLEQRINKAVLDHFIATGKGCSAQCISVVWIPDVRPIDIGQALRGGGTGCERVESDSRVDQYRPSCELLRNLIIEQQKQIAALTKETP